MENPTEKNLSIGELYLFNKVETECPAESSLWGIVESMTDDVINLESLSLDLKEFIYHKSLPTEYKYNRISTRDELRDYIYNQAAYETNNNYMRALMRSLNIDLNSLKKIE